MKKSPEGIVILHMCTINDNHDVQFLRYGARQTDFFCHFELFLPFYPPNDPKNQNFEKMKKKWLEIISFTQLYQKS